MDPIKSTQVFHIHLVEVSKFPEGQGAAKVVEDSLHCPSHIPVGNYRCCVLQGGLAHWHCQRPLYFQTWYCKYERVLAPKPEWEHLKYPTQPNHLYGWTHWRCRLPFLEWDFLFFSLPWDYTREELPDTCDVSGGEEHIILIKRCSLFLVHTPNL